MKNVTRRAYEHAASLEDNPWVLGIGGPDLPIWDDKLVRKYWSLKADSPGRIRYAAFLRDRYSNDVVRFNQVYKTNFVSFEDLAQQTKIVYPCDADDDELDSWTLRWRLPVLAENSMNPEMTRDNEAFCALIVSTLFPQIRDAVKRGAPNHLFMGEHPAIRMIPDAVITAMAPHIDVYLAQAVEVSPQRPPEWQVFQSNRWDHEYALHQKPTVIHWSVRAEQMSPISILRFTDQANAQSPVYGELRSSRKRSGRLKISLGVNFKSESKRD